MDFGLAYSTEQERFRQEVRTWIERSYPEEMRLPVDERDYTPEMHEFWKEKQPELAARGWLFPTYPKEYGGGGLTADHETILQEEFTRARIPRPISSTYTLAVLLVWASEEQKQRFLVPLLKAEKFEHMRMTEPHSGADLANVQSRAVRDGDDWIINGVNVFISAYGDEDYFPGPILTDPDAPRHRNLGYFVVPNPSPGLTVKEMNLLVGNRQKIIYMDNVRVPGSHLIGGDHDGWQVHATHLEEEHGGRGRAFPHDRVVTNMLTYVQETRRDGESLGKDPLVQQTAMDAYLEAHVDGLMAKRAYWMYQAKQDVTWQGNLHNVHSRQYTLRNAIRVRDVYGMYSLLDSKETLAPNGAVQEVEQRSAAGQHHGAGSSNIAKVILARRIGISRTRERPAPTPATATPYHG